MNALQAALTYATRGWQIVPLNWPRLPGCSCQRGDNCPSAGKHPWIRWKDSGGTTDPELVRWYWQRRPQSGVAVLTGTSRSGIFVLDVDTGGDEYLDRLQSAHGQLPTTLEAITGSGGRHLVFHVTGPSPTDAGQLGPHLDRRGDGGLVAFAPTLHRTGHRYRWVDWETPVAAAPAWLLRSQRPERSIRPTDRIAAMTATGNNFLDAAAQAIAGATDGHRHHTIVRASWSVAALVQAGKLDEYDARRALLDAADRAGYDKTKSEDAIDSAFAKRRRSAA